MARPPAVLTREHLDEVVAAYLEFDEYVYDVETKGLHRADPRRNDIFWVSLAGPGRADVIPCGHPVGRMISPAAKEKRKNPATGRMKNFDVPAKFAPPPEQLWVSEVMEALRPLLFSERRKVGHNIRFDMESTAKYYGGELPPPPYGDTLIMARLIEENHMGSYPYSLASCVERDFGFKFARIGARVDQVEFRQAFSYNFWGAKYAWLAWKKYNQWLDHEKVRKVWEWMEEPIISVVMDMEMAGAPISSERLKVLGEGFAQEMADLSLRLNSLWQEHHVAEEKKKKCPRCGSEYGKDFNPNANRQVAEMVYDIRSHRCTNFTDTGERQVNKDTLEAFGRDKVVKDLLRWSQLEKLKSSFVDSLIPKIYNGRIHPELNQIGTVSGRWTCNTPNLQQVPVRSDEGREVRGCFVAPKGHKLIIADFSQIELRVLAHFSRDPLLMKAYQEGLDLHALTARRAYHIAEREPVSVEHRSLAKNVNFSVVFQVGPRTLVVKYKVPSEREAKHLIETFYQTYKQVRPWIRYELVEARRRYQKKEDGHSYVPPHILTLLGRKRRLPELFWADDYVRSRAERQAINSKIQGSAADINKIALIDVRRALIDGGFETQMVLSVHDEVVLVAPDDEADEAVVLVKKTMEGVVHPETGKPLLRVPIIVDAKVAETWAEKG